MLIYEDDDIRIMEDQSITTDSSLWLKYRVYEWIDGYGWDEIIHPTAKKEILKGHINAHH